MPPADQCPLCPSIDGRQTEIPALDYDVAVFENRFPSFPALVDPAGENRLTAGDPDGDPELAPHGGRCEVVSFTAEHTGSFAGLTPRRARTVIDAWAQRTGALSTQDGVKQVFVFENRGVEIGVTLSHPHGQIYAYPYVAPTLAAQLDRARAHREATGRNLFADVLAAEVEDGRRVILRSSAWTVFVPAAARWPIEVHVYPNRQVADLTELDDHERDDLARVYLETLRRVEAIFDAAIPYIAGWYQAPGRSRSRSRLPAPAAVLPAAHGDQAEVPGRLRDGHGRVHQRRPARGHRRPVASRHDRAGGPGVTAVTWAAPAGST